MNVLEILMILVIIVLVGLSLYLRNKLKKISKLETQTLELSFEDDTERTPNNIRGKLDSKTGLYSFVTRRQVILEDGTKKYKNISVYPILKPSNK